MEFPYSGLLTACILPLICCSCAIPGDSPWSGLHFEVAAAQSSFDFDGTALTDDGSTPPVTSDFNFQSDGGLAGSSTLPYFEFAAGLAPLELRLTTFEYQSNSLGSFSGNFLGIGFAGGIHSDLDLRGIRGTLGFDIFNNDRFRAAVTAGLNSFLVNFRVDDTTGTGAFRELDELLPVPVVGMRGDFDLPLNTRVGIAITTPILDRVTGYDLGLVDTEVSARWSLTDNSEIVLGSRNIELFFSGEIENSPARVDLDLSGTFAGVSINF